MEHDIRVFRPSHLPMRVLSLRVIVIVGQLAVITLVLILGAGVGIGATNDQYSQLDRRLASGSGPGDITTPLNSPPPSNPDQPAPGATEVRTPRIGSIAVSAPSGIVLPKLEN